MDDDDLFYSDGPLSSAELRHMRKLLSDAEELRREREQLRLMLLAYQTAGKIGRAAWIIGAWIIGATIAGLGILTAVKEMGWWRWNPP